MLAHGEHSLAGHCQRKVIVFLNSRASYSVAELVQVRVNLSRYRFQKFKIIRIDNFEQHRTNSSTSSVLWKHQSTELFMFHDPRSNVVSPIKCKGPRSTCIHCDPRSKVRAKRSKIPLSISHKPKPQRERKAEALSLFSFLLLLAF